MVRNASSHTIHTYERPYFACVHTTGVYTVSESLMYHTLLTQSTLGFKKDSLGVRKSSVFYNSRPLRVPIQTALNRGQRDSEKTKIKKLSGFKTSTIFLGRLVFLHVLYRNGWHIPEAQYRL